MLETMNFLFLIFFQTKNLIFCFNFLCLTKFIFIIVTNCSIYSVNY